MPLRHVQNLVLIASHLLQQVLEMEPWNDVRHVSGRGTAVWRDCAKRVPGFLKKNARTDPRNAVQQRIFRMVHQLNDPAAGYPWELYPEVKQRVEDVAAKLAVDWPLKARLRPKSSNQTTVETAHAIQEQKQEQEQLVTQQ